MTFYIVTLGCKVNTYESEVIKEKLLSHHFKLAASELESDIIIINTCSVTNMADNKSKKMVRRAKRLNKVVVVCGCSSENLEKDYQEMGIDVLIGNNEKSKIAVLIKNYLDNKKRYEKFYRTRDLAFEDMEVSKFTSLTRAYVKIQDGCNNFCTYCIIPYVRGNVRNKDFFKAIKEVETLVLNGHKEIVLTGIHTGSYHDNGKDLADLIHEISKIKDLKRIRISSIEVTELNDKMLLEIEKNEKIVNHFHVPLQAGSNEILKSMNRKYDLCYFEEKLKRLRQIKKEVSITTDVIVGFPGETEALFLKTVETVKKFEFSKIHVFPYSIRTGTLASQMINQVLDSEKHQRSQILNQISLELEQQFLKSFFNQELEVLIEQVFENYSIGTTSNYIKVRLNKKMNKNEFVKVKIVTCQETYLIGEELIYIS